MLDYFFVSSSNGALYDTRSKDWASQPPLRRNFERTHRTIHTVADLKATLRAGPYAWPGGYPMYFICDDGGALSFKTVRAELRQIMWAIRTKDRGGWRVVGCDVNWEETDLTDAHTGDTIECAYNDAATETSQK